MEPFAFHPGRAAFPPFGTAHVPPNSPFASMDQWRGMQARTLDLFGYGTHECPFEIIEARHNWRLRHYPGRAADIPIMCVPAPIKRPYIWDLSPEVSTVRFCRDRPFDVHLIEWVPPTPDDGAVGLEDYAGFVLAACRTVAAQHGGTPPVVFGHSLGGTLAAIACALDPTLARALVLLGAPLAFEPGSSRFRDTVVAQKNGAEHGPLVAGSELSQGCALLSPETFLWPRWMGAALSLADPGALDIHMRVERWALDEVPLAGRLVHEMVDWLYREDRFHLGNLSLHGRNLGPEDLTLPALAIVNTVDEIGPRAAIEPFFARMATPTWVIEHPPEVGVGLQHLAVLAGRRTHADIWPQIADWVEANA